MIMYYYKLYLSYINNVRHRAILEGRPQFKPVGMRGWYTSLAICFGLRNVPAAVTEAHPDISGRFVDRSGRPDSSVHVPKVHTSKSP